MSYSASARIYCVKARFKRWVFKSRQKDSVLVQAWMEAGRLFHTAGPAWLFSLHPRHFVQFTASGPQVLVG